MSIIAFLTALWYRSRFAGLHRARGLRDRLNNREKK